MTIYTFMPSPHRNTPLVDHPRTILWIMLHTTQNQCVNGVARNVGHWFQSPMLGQDGKPHPASSHYIVGPDETIQCVLDSQIAWHACSPANEKAIGIEMVGDAYYTAAQWALPNQQKVIAATAKLVAEKCVEHNLPPEYRSADDLKAGVVGITDHRQASLAWHNSTHTDVGEHFPWDSFLAMVVQNMTPPDA